MHLAWNMDFPRYFFMKVAINAIRARFPGTTAVSVAPTAGTSANEKKKFNRK